MPKVDKANRLHSNGVSKNWRSQSPEFPILGLRCDAERMIVPSVPGVAHDLGRCSLLQIMDMMQEPGQMRIQVGRHNSGSDQLVELMIQLDFNLRFSSFTR
ncbi:hypothetical protein PDENDC454_20487 [Paenibacillus dendritiformis C454]|uniref:Uncharacterized protein n=1 Tax=Paenibacillus dendritiformis C454 TaxID=1131935 RepID=H3SKJ8_9BACL|nr:hypothetical protein PDENDC454_20487 [Paenibacillus dendritiformis C454]